MKYLSQFLMILAVSLIGEILKYLLPFPVPASIYGMVLMFFGLMTGIIKLDSVKETGKFFVEIMPIFFIPAGVGLMASWQDLQAFLLPICVITVVTLIIVMGATGLVSQRIIRQSRKGGAE